ncbi:MAG: SIR2 family protein [Candidatus Margulisiibacteriota bacterium]|nr:SIR2 family protein [Candidatus Margulisiibacteriota bacterium]
MDKRIILLTGAGFTKNFGGFLADEMWAYIFNHKNIQISKELKDLAYKHFNYEDLYDEVLKSEKNLPAFIEVIDKAYQLQEKSIKANLINRSQIPINFCEFLKSHVASIFTLNQDLCFETSIISTKGTAIDLQFELPFSPDNRKAHPFDKSPKLLPSKKELDKLEKTTDISNNLNYFKLHGSTTYYSSILPGQKVLVIGREKNKLIANEPLLNKYKIIFEQNLQEDNQSLLVIGYSFLDEHINEVIESGLKNGLKLYIVDTLSPEEFKRKMLDEEIKEFKQGAVRLQIKGKKHGIDKNNNIAYLNVKLASTKMNIFKSMAGYYPFDLIQFLDQHNLGFFKENVGLV